MTQQVVFYSIHSILSRVLESDNKQGIQYMCVIHSSPESYSFLCILIIIQHEIFKRIYQYLILCYTMVSLSDNKCGPF